MNFFVGLALGVACPLRLSDLCYGAGVSRRSFARKGAASFRPGRCRRLHRIGPAVEPSEVAVAVTRARAAGSWQGFGTHNLGPQQKKQIASITQAGDKASPCRCQKHTTPEAPSRKTRASSRALGCSRGGAAVRQRWRALRTPCARTSRWVRTACTQGPRPWGTALGPGQAERGAFQGAEVCLLARPRTAPPPRHRLHTYLVRRNTERARVNPPGAPAAQYAATFSSPLPLGVKKKVRRCTAAATRLALPRLARPALRIALAGSPASAVLASAAA